jgi:integrase
VSASWLRKRSVKVTARNPRGVTWQVLYRRGGRHFPIETAGTFKTEKEARTRRDLVGGWLAQGLNPKVELAAIAAAEAPRLKTPAQWRDEWLASRHDLEQASERTYRAGLNAILPLLPVDELEQMGVAGLPDRRRAPRRHVQARDHVALLAGVQAAPRLRRRRAEPGPRPACEAAADPPGCRRRADARAHGGDAARARDKYLLPFALLETTAVRVETIDAATWDNVDIAGSRLRVVEKGRKVRFVPVPGWLMGHLAETCAPEDRTADAQAVPGRLERRAPVAMRSACQQAGSPALHPHDLRHRRASLWHLQAIPDAVLAERLGHEKASFSKDVYAHVMPVDELPVESWEALLS